MKMAENLGGRVAFVENFAGAGNAIAMFLFSQEQKNFSFVFKGGLFLKKSVVNYQEVFMSVINCPHH